MHGKRNRRGILVCIAALLASGCSKPQAAPATAAAVPVRVATVVQKTVPVQVTAIGNVEAYSTVAIKALVAGELTAVHFREGQDVHKGDLLFEIYRPPLVVINQLNPIYVNFALPEQYLAEVKKFMAGGKLRVEAVIPEGLGGSAGAAKTQTARTEEGALSFVDNAVDNTTGTIRMKATFANQQRRLWPGQFVNVVLTLAKQPNTIVIPAQALQTGQAWTYVYRVNPDGTVESRVVVPGRTVRGETMVEKGLKPGELVVTDGQLRLVPGSKVIVKGGLEAGSTSGQGAPSGS